MSRRIEGQFYPRQSSDVRTGAIIVDGDAVRLDIPDIDFDAVNLPKFIDRDDLKIEPGLANIRRKIYLPNGLMFETDDGDGVNAIDRGRGWKFISRLERTGWHLIPFAVLTPVLAFGFYRLMIPLFVTLGLYLTPQGLPKRIDKSTLASMDRFWMRPSETKVDRQIELQVLFNDLLDERVKPRTRNAPSYELKFRRMRPEMPNAFALPGGTIVMTDAMINGFDDDDVLASILAHEIAHVEQEHSLRRIYRALGIAALINLIAGDAGPMLEDVLLEGSALLSLSYSRDHELAADSYAVQMMIDAGRPPEKMTLFFEALSRGEMSLPKPFKPLPGYDDQGDNTLDSVLEDDLEIQTPKKTAPQDWYSTHPMNKTRIENIKRLSATLKPTR